jgi:transcription elongation factor GreA
MSDVLTAEGLEKLKAELAELKEVKLKEVAKRIKESKELGDLSENAEYHEAKNEQAFLFGKVITLERKIHDAVVINKSGCAEVVEAGCTVEVENSEGKNIKYEIVGSTESDPLNGRISIDSPIGSAFAGHKKGDCVTVATPKGETKYKIISIS